MRLEVRKNERGAWCVWIDGKVVSDHSTPAAALIAARNHYIAAVREAKERGR